VTDIPDSIDALRAVYRGQRTFVRNVPHARRGTTSTSRTDERERDKAMNRQERRRRAAINRENKFVEDYVRHLPEVGFEALGKPGVCHMVCYHDDWCRIYDGEACNCDPHVRLFAEPKRS